MASGRNAHIISKYIGSNPQPASNVKAPVRSCASNIAELSIMAARFVSGTLEPILESDYRVVHVWMERRQLGNELL